MPFDGIVLAAVHNEISENLRYSRIQGVYQPEPDELLLRCRRPGQSLHLLLSASPRYARVHLTQVPRHNPESPPSFCMLLRKYLHGGRIVDLCQPGFERIYRLTVEAFDERGRRRDHVLIAETMGRHSNIILVDKNSNKILGAMHHVTEEISRYRQVLPGLPYKNPPGQGKINPLHMDQTRCQSIWNEADPDIKLANSLVRNFTGISPASARALVCNAGVDPDTPLPAADDPVRSRLSCTLQQLFAQINNGHFQPTLYLDTAGEAVDVLAVDNPAVPAEQKKRFASVSEMLDVYFEAQITRQRKDHLRSRLINAVDTALQRCQKKLALQRQKLEKAKQAGEYRKAGELLTANIYRVERGQSSISVQDYYSPDSGTIHIELDPALSPSENAQRYFKKYQKAKKTRTTAARQLDQTQSEIQYLQGVKTSIELADTLDELELIRPELVQQGYMKEKTGRSRSKTRTGQPASRPLEFILGEVKIYVGKNNRQNDELYRNTQPADIWLHAKDIPGAHVIIKTSGKEIQDKVINRAAGLAAYYSKGRESTNVPVDYTFARYVRKPRGAKPGMVIYDHQTTLYVDPLQP